MRVLIIGFGSMGREVEKVLLERGHTVSARVDPAQKGVDAKELGSELAGKSDIAIEFSHADAVLENARRYVSFGLSAVCGTTGWYGRLEELKGIVGPSRIGYLY
ncbi:MAG: 4-hydroxy-tetrahydrodipicolinate reductase, partial [Spirochaetia bacterium]